MNINQKSQGRPGTSEEISDIPNHACQRLSGTNDIGLEGIISGLNRIYSSLLREKGLDHKTKEGIASLLHPDDRRLIEIHYRSFDEFWADLSGADPLQRKAVPDQEQDSTKGDGVTQASLGETKEKPEVISDTLFVMLMGSVITAIALGVGLPRLFEASIQESQAEACQAHIDKLAIALAPYYKDPFFLENYRGKFDLEKDEFYFTRINGSPHPFIKFNLTPFIPSRSLGLYCQTKPDLASGNLIERCRYYEALDVDYRTIQTCQSRIDSISNKLIDERCFIQDTDYSFPYAALKEFSENAFECRRSYIKIYQVEPL